MPINNQINNIFHSILHNQGHKMIVNTIQSNSLFDTVLDTLEDYIFVDHTTIQNTSLSYGSMIINNPMIIANNASYFKQTYCNKAIFLHSNLFNELKKEDQYLLYHSMKHYPIFSFIPNLPLDSNSVNYIKYGIKTQISKLSNQRDTDILILYDTDKKQAEILFRIIKNQFDKVEMLHSKNLKQYDVIPNILNNAKLCIDLSCYYNILVSIGCGCFGITRKQSYDPNFIITINDLNDINNLIGHILNRYNDDYIRRAEEYIINTYNYLAFQNNIATVLKHLSNMAITTL